jgi:integrase
VTSDRGDRGTEKGRYGDGSLTERGENSFRLRYRIGNERYSVTFRGTRKEAQAKLRELLKSGDDGTHIEPSRMTVAEWCEHWLSTGCPIGKKRRLEGRSTIRYRQLLQNVIPVLGQRRLQQLTASEIDSFYVGLESTLGQRTQNSVHSVFNACLNAAVRTGRLAINPINRCERIPSAGESDHGQVLDAKQLEALVQSFRGSSIYEIVAVAAFTGARRNEILALRWTDLDPVAKTLRIERSLEESRGAIQRFKGPKRESHKRTITIDDALVRLLLSVREQHLRLMACVPAGAAVDLGLIKLPSDALMFPSPVGPDLTRARNSVGLTRQFENHARKQYPGLRLHDLRGSHETALLDSGVPVHVVAKRCGHDPATLLRSYAKRTKGADASAAKVIGELLGGPLKG